MEYDERKLLQFRKEKDDYFRSSHESPLTDKQKESFTGLFYYPPNLSLVFQNLAIKPEEGEQIIRIPTSTGDDEPYKKIGKISITIEGKVCQLSIYKDLDSDHYFLPIKDKTSGEETYGAGRYIEIGVANGVIGELDFNYAYNPYCAYNYNWRCPLTPSENTLTVSITAGEKNFHEGVI